MQKVSLASRRTSFHSSPKAKEIILQKKDAFAQLPNTFSTDGLFPTDAGVTVVRLLSAQFEGVRALVMNVSDAIILVAPTVGIAYKPWKLGD